MRNTLLILISIYSFCCEGICQTKDTSHPAVFTIKHKPALKVIYSRSSTIYMGMPNLVKVINVDSLDAEYTVHSDYGPVLYLGFNKFNVYALRPTPIKLTLYRKFNHDSAVLESKTFNVETMPSSKLAVAGSVINYAISDTLLLSAKQLEILPDTGILSNSWLHVASFNIRVNGRTYSSETDKLTDEMIKALEAIKGQRINPVTKKNYTIDFTNIIAAGNGTQEPLKDVTGIIIVN